jgi:HrpA-like RNA helicase
LDEPPGSILVFLTGQDEIEYVRRSLTDAASSLSHPRDLELAVVAIYAALPPEEQAAAFQPAPVGTRKVVLATNIAETSVTVPGVRYVVDSGMVKARAYSATRGMESLQVCFCFHLLYCKIPLPVAYTDFALFPPAKSHWLESQMREAPSICCTSRSHG